MNGKTTCYLFQTCTLFMFIGTVVRANEKLINYHSNEEIFSNSAQFRIKCLLKVCTYLYWDICSYLKLNSHPFVVNKWQSKAYSFSEFHRLMLRNYGGVLSAWFSLQKSKNDALTCIGHIWTAKHADSGSVAGDDDVTSVWNDRSAWGTGQPVTAG